VPDPLDPLDPEVFMSLARLILLAPLFVLGCDADKDGLTNAEEEELGTDPESADSDKDGLDDFDEMELGTDPLLADTDEDGLEDGDEDRYGADPLVADTDGDTYLDGWEVNEGSDPSSEDSRIYMGYWPYHPNKDSLEAPEYSDTKTTEGDPMPHFVLMDQFEDMVDIYDFYGQDANIIIDLSAMWCGPCQAYSAWLSGDPAYTSYDNEWPSVREKIENRELFWVTVLGEDTRGNVPDIVDIVSWDESYTNENIPVLTVEGDTEFRGFFLNSGWPSIYLYDAELKVVAAPSRSNYYQAIYDADTL
jgi:thiol-disulfide isomerase/thioredoxin